MCAYWRAGWRRGLRSEGHKDHLPGIYPVRVGDLRIGPQDLLHRGSIVAGNQGQVLAPLHRVIHAALGLGRLGGDEEQRQDEHQGRQQDEAADRLLSRQDPTHVTLHYLPL